MNKLHLSVAAIALTSMFSMSAFADDMTTPAATAVVTGTCSCPADKIDCKTDAVGDDCTNHGGTVVDTGAMGTDHKVAE